MHSQYGARPGTATLDARPAGRPALFALCQRLIVLDKGRIVADGPIQEVIAASGAAGSLTL